MKIVAIICLFLFRFSLSPQAQKPPEYSAFSIFYDQDYLFEKIGLNSLNEDRNYTMGLGLSLTLPSLKHSFLFAPHYRLNKILGKEYFNDPAGNSPEIINSLMLGNGSFTPDDLTRYDVISNDRPYGSLTYLQSLITYVDTRRFRQRSSTFTMGVLGSFISREVQTAIHTSMNQGDTRPPRTPRGWDNQISNGGEPTLAYTFEEERLLKGEPEPGVNTRSKFALELKHGWKYSVGYYTMTDYAFNFRFGKIDPNNWTYRVNPLGNSNHIIKAAAPQLFEQSEKRSNWELYAFGSVRPTFMLYNALLNGQFRKSAYTIDFQHMRHLILGFDGGLGSSIPFGGKNLAEFKLMISGRSPEFALPGRAPRWHSWVGVQLIVSHGGD